MLKINYEKIANNTGRTFENVNDLLYYIDRSLYYLETHNKNYNNTQHEKILELREFFNAIETE